MSKKLKINFYVLFTLYVVLILANWNAIFYFSQRVGFLEALRQGNIFYEIAIIVIAFFMAKKNYYILPISLVLMTYWLITMPVFYVDKYGIGAIILIKNFFGFNQSFFLLLSSWLIPIVSLVGCIFWYLDVKKSKSLGKHWSK